MSVLLYNSTFAKTERLLTRKHQSEEFWLDEAFEVIQFSPTYLCCEQGQLRPECPVKFRIFPRIPHDLSVLLRKQASSLREKINPRLRLFMAFRFVQGSYVTNSPVTLQSCEWDLRTAQPAEHLQKPCPQLAAPGGLCKPPPELSVIPPDSAETR